jgi:hypothetical protein
MIQKQFFKKFDVMTFKHKHYGFALLAGGVLVKLRKAAHTPIWRCLGYEEFCARHVI